MSRIRVRIGESEIELEGADEFIKKHLQAFYARLNEPTAHVAKIKEQLLGPPKKVAHSGKTPTPAEYYKQKGKTDGISQILVFGKYLEEYRNKTSFTRTDINAVAHEAKLAKDVHTQYFTNAVKQGLLRKDGKDYSLTLTAEEYLAGK